MISHLRLPALFLALIAALLLWFPALAQEGDPPAPQPLVLTDESGKTILGKYIDILEDPSGELTINDVTTPEIASNFQRSSADVPIYGFTNSTFWIRMRFRNETSLTQNFLLEANFPNLNYLDLYLPSDNDGYFLKQSGALLPFETRDIPYYHVVFELPLSSQEEQTFFLRVQSGSSMTLAFTFWQPETFAAEKMTDMLLNGLFYGALLIILSLHLFLYFFLKDIIYLYFSFFLTGSILFFFTYEGLADQYIWPGYSQNKLPLILITMSIFNMFSLKFSDEYLDQKSKAPHFHKVFNILIGIWGLMIVIMPFFSYGFMGLLTSPLRILTPLFASITGIYLWRKGHQLAGIYLISWLGFFIGLILAELVRSGVLPSTPLTERFYHAGLIWLVLMWCLALADRINLLRAESKDANRLLVESESRLKKFLEAMPVGVMVYDANQKLNFINQRARTLLKDPNEKLKLVFSPDQPLDEIIPTIKLTEIGGDEPYLREQRPTVRAFQGEYVESMDLAVHIGDYQVPLEVWARPIEDARNQIEYVLMTFQDITKRKLTEAELMEYHHQLEQLVDQRTAELSSANKLLWVEIGERHQLEEILRLRLEWMVLSNQIAQNVSNSDDLTQAYHQIVGMIKKLFGADEALLAEFDTRSKELVLLSHTLHNDNHPDLIGKPYSLSDSILTDLVQQPGQPIYFPLKRFGDLAGSFGDHLRVSGFKLLVFVTLHDQENIRGLLGLEYLQTEKLFSASESALVEKICLDITQIREKVNQSEKYQLLVAAEERNRLARDLHDSVTQVLFSANLMAEVLPQIWRRDPETGLKSLDNLRLLTRGALAEMRTLLLELRPSALIKTPLGDLLAQLTEAIVSRKMLPFQLSIQQVPTLPENVHLSFYRIAQESLNNIIKHAEASQVAVSLSANPMSSNFNDDWQGEVILKITDNGRGFAVEESEANHLGLAIMRERAEAIHADLSVESQPGRGTTVTLIWHN